jgi:hypothetical protein
MNSDGVSISAITQHFRLSGRERAGGRWWQMQWTPLSQLQLSQDRSILFAGRCPCGLCDGGNDRSWTRLALPHNSRETADQGGFVRLCMTLQTAQISNAAAVRGETQSHLHMTMTRPPLIQSGAVNSSSACC